MEQQPLIALQVVLYTASGAMIVVAAVLIHVLLDVRKQIARAVTAVESVNAEITPLARETRVVVARLRDISERAERQMLAVESWFGTIRQWTDRTQRVVEIASTRLLSPVLAANRTARLLRIGTTAFLRTLWTGRRHTKRTARAS